MLQRPLFGDIAEDRRIDLAVEQHLLDRFAFRRALHILGIAIFGQMRVLENNPGDAIQIDAVILGQKAAHPGARRLGIGAHADALAVQIARRQRPRSAL